MKRQALTPKCGQSYREAIRNDKERMSFVLDVDVPHLIKEDRLQLVLVRCGNGRFLCPVQDLDHFVNIITKEDSDYVRDVSIPV